MTNYNELVKVAIKKAYEDAAAQQAAAEKEIRVFEVGKTYQTRSICNHDCIFSVEVVSRTAKTVVVRKEGKEQRNKITVIDGRETIHPYKCLKKAMGDEKLACHVNSIIVQLGKSIESQFTYYNESYDMWCDYFL